MISRDEFVKAFDAKETPTAPPAAAVSAQDVLKCCSFSIDSITTKAVALWDARGCLANARGSRSEASIWAADLADPHWKRGMLGTATLSVPLGVFGHGSRKNPTNAKLLTISARRFKRVDVTAVRDRWLPTAVAFRRIVGDHDGKNESLYVWTRSRPRVSQLSASASHDSGAPRVRLGPVPAQRVGRARDGQAAAPVRQRGYAEPQARRLVAHRVHGPARVRPRPRPAGARAGPQPGVHVHIAGRGRAAAPAQQHAVAYAHAAPASAAGLCPSPPRSEGRLATPILSKPRVRRGRVDNLLRHGPKKRVLPPQFAL